MYHYLWYKLYMFGQYVVFPEIIQPGNKEKQNSTKKQRDSTVFQSTSLGMSHTDLTVSYTF